MFVFKKHGKIEDDTDYIELIYKDDKINFRYVPHDDLICLILDENIDGDCGSIFGGTLTWNKDSVRVYSEDCGDASVGSIDLTVPNHPDSGLKEALIQLKEYSLLRTRNI